LTDVKRYEEVDEIILVVVIVLRSDVKESQALELGLF
jgi:hypothetical protein